MMHGVSSLSVAWESPEIQRLPPGGGPPSDLSIPRLLPWVPHYLLLGCKGAKLPSRSFPIDEERTVCVPIRNSVHFIYDTGHAPEFLT